MARRASLSILFLARGYPFGGGGVGKCESAGLHGVSLGPLECICVLLLEGQGGGTGYAVFELVVGMTDMRNSFGEGTMLVPLQSCSRRFLAYCGGIGLNN